MPYKIIQIVVGEYNFPCLLPLDEMKLGPASRVRWLLDPFVANIAHYINYHYIFCFQSP